MTFREPTYFYVSEDAFAHLAGKLGLPAMTDMQTWQTWAIQVAGLHQPIQYIDAYTEAGNLGAVGDEVKYALFHILLACLDEQEINLETPLYNHIHTFLQRDYHLLESAVYMWATLAGVAEGDAYYALQQSMRALFAFRYLTSITYTYEMPSNYSVYSVYYDAFKLTCYENQDGIFGYVEIHNASKDEWHTHYFDVSEDAWVGIAKQCNLLAPCVINRYYSQMAEEGNHILELHNTHHDLFYKLNWFESEPTEATPIQNFLIRNALLELLDVDIETLAKYAFPQNIDLRSMTQMEIINHNAAAWDAEFKFLEEVIQTRFNLHMGNTSLKRSVYEISLPTHSRYANLGRLIEVHSFGFEQRVILALAMAVHLRPQSLDLFFQRNQAYDRTFTEAGGLKGKFHSGFLPTFETATFLLAGKDISKRIQFLHYYFGEASPFIQHNILRLEVKEPTEPVGAGQLVMSNEYVEYLTTGKPFRPSYKDNFPAELLTTELEWKDLFLEKETFAEIQNIETWLTYQTHIMHELKLKKHLKLGYRALFYGSSGTGKTLTATLLGKALGLDVYRVDLSMISSKWIGETTKNLARLFDIAENKNWILFFDEAESLFGKRATNIQRATDAYYNQEVGYILQRIENYNGLVILATNLLDNIDTAFMRRFQSLVYFPVPSVAQQLALWQHIFSVGLPLSRNVSFKTLSEKYVLTASNITNVLRYATIKTLQDKNKKITMQTLTEGITKELTKANLREKVGF